MKKFILSIFTICCTGLMVLKAQNYGFEASVSTPPLNWTAVSGAWITDTVSARTGNNCMRITDPATTGTTMGNTSMFANVPTPNTHFLITMAYARSNVLNGVLYLGHRNSTGTNTIFPNTITTGQPVNMDTSNYRRIVSVSTGTIATAGNYSVAMRAFRSATNPTGTTIFIDDAIIYASTTNVPDTVAPRVPLIPSVLLATNNQLNWNYNGDSGAVSSGLAGAVILRTLGSAAIPPVLNHQAFYATSTGAAGTSTFIQNAQTWHVVGVVGSNSTNFIDFTSDPLETYTYAIAVFDTARNYSPAVFAQVVTPQAMQFDSINAIAINAVYNAGRVGANVMGIRVFTTGTLTSLPITEFNLGLGATNTTLVTRARLFNTRNSSQFDTTRLFGTINNPTPVFTISGLDTLQPGINHFWLVYDIDANASNCAALDASIYDAVVDGITRFVVDTNPSGSSLVRLPLQGDFTIDPSQQASCANANYTTFQSAIADLQTLGVGGNVRFLIPAGTVFVTSPIIISNIPNGVDTITFTRFGTGANPLVYGINGGGTTDAIFSLEGVSRIVIDGINVRDTSINIDNTTRMEYGFKIIGSSADRGSSFNVIKNSSIVLNRINTASIGLLQSAAATGGGFVPTSPTGANHNNKYINIKLTNSYGGYYLLGNSIFPDSNCVITSEGSDSTVIGALTGNDIGNGISPLIYGIQAQNQRNVEISRTSVRNLTITGTLTLQGIYLNNIGTDADYGHALIYNNRVFNLNRANTSVLGAMHGIRIDVSENATADVYNNEVFNLTTSNSTTVTANIIVRGIAHCVSGNGNARYFNNSVSINTAGALSLSSAAFFKAGTGDIELYNNIFSNITPNQTGVAFHAASVISAGTVSEAKSNIYWAPNDSGFVGRIGTINYTNLNQYRIALATLRGLRQIDQGSMNLNPQFASSGVLDIPFPNSATQSGWPVSFIQVDINRNPRNLSNPTIGAYENAQPFIDNSTPIITDVTISDGVNPVVSAFIRDNNQLLPSQISLWYRLGSSGAFVQALPDTTPATINGIYQWSLAFTALPIGSYEFYITARDTVGQGVNIGVWPLFNSSFTAFSSVDPPNFLTNPPTDANTAVFNKTGVLLSGTYTIGLGGDYLNLTQVSNALVTNEITGNVVFEFLPSYDGVNTETLPILFRPINTAANAPYTVTIRPALGTTSVITAGDPGTGNAIISFDRASRYILDGRQGGTGTTRHWTIRNTRALTTHGAVIQFINGSQLDTVRYVNIQQLNTNTLSGAVVIGTTNNAMPNNRLVIENCAIGARTDTANAAPANAIYASGTSGSANSDITIKHNEFYDFTTNGIFVTATGSRSQWNISNNHFYMTAPRSTAQTAIRLTPGVISTRNTVEYNFIGGSQPFAAGVAWNNTGNVAWRALVVTVGTTDSNFIRHNTITNLNLNGTGTGSFAAIEATSGLVMYQNNRIGTDTAIVSTTLGVQIGIWINGLNNIPTITDNFIQNITSTGNTTAVGVNAIRVTNAATGQLLRIENNVIRNITAANPTASNTTASLVGILTLHGGVQQRISNNIISNLINTSATGATIVMGVNIANATAIAEISKNEIYGLRHTSQIANAYTSGIHLAAVSSSLVHNNMVSLGYNTTADIELRGINDVSNGTNNRFVFNTVNISGTASTSSFNYPTYAFLRNGSSVNNLQNNIFKNVRAGSATHIAIANTVAPVASGWIADRNNLFAINSLNTGRWLTNNVGFAGWQVASLQDVNSVNITTFHVADTNLRLTSISIGDLQLSARPFAGITLDIDGETRDPFFPYMGADENTASPLPVSLVRFEATATGNDVLVSWSTASELNASHFEIEVSTDLQSFENIATVRAKGNSNTLISYKHLHANVKQKGSNLYYRLRMVDLDGSYAYSSLVNVQCNERNESAISVTPNPFNDYIQLSGINQPTTVVVYDINGREVYSGIVESGQTQIETSNWNIAGFYYIKLVNASQSQVIKLMKQPK